MSTSPIQVRAGAEVVQVYVHAPPQSGEPSARLKGFAKVMLEPGETQRVTVALDPRAFSVWDTGSAGWTVVAGRYEIRVGDSSRHLPLHASIDITK